VSFCSKSMASSTRYLSIVIVSWNTRDLLRRCLFSVDAQSLPESHGPPEVFVVDNASSDGSPEMVRAEFPQVRLIENLGNVGFATANNQALAIARGDLRILLNPDTVLLPGALATLIRFMDDCPAAGAAGANLLNPDGTLQNSAYPMLGLGRELWQLFHLDRIGRLASYPLSDWAGGDPHRVGVAQGACLALRREALDQVGLLDEQYFMYTEEVDLCYRLARGGWEVYWVPQARVLHFGGQSTRQAEVEMFLALYQSKVRFFRKHFGNRAARAYKLILGLASVPRLFTRAVGAPVSGDELSPQSSVAHRYRRLLASLHQM